jgi:hypothetical protein
VDENGCLVEQSDETPSHFCDFPLIGSEEQMMPVLINSPDFEPDSERASLFLDRPERDSEKDEITETRINRMILLETIPLFNTLVEYCCVECRKLYFLLRGIKTVPSFPKFDGLWFERSILTKYREILAKHPIVETENGRQKLFTEEGDCQILFIQEAETANEEDENEGGLYDLYRDLCGANRLALKNTNSIWFERVWKGCGISKIAELCHEVQKLKSATTLEARLKSDARLTVFE